MYLVGLTTKKSGRMQRKGNVDARIPEIWAAIGVVRICRQSHTFRFETSIIYDNYTVAFWSMSWFVLWYGVCLLILTFLGVCLSKETFYASFQPPPPWSGRIQDGHGVMPWHGNLVTPTLCCERSFNEGNSARNWEFLILNLGSTETVRNTHRIHTTLPLWFPKNIFREKYFVIHCFHSFLPFLARAEMCKYWWWDNLFCLGRRELMLMFSSEGLEEMFPILT